MGVRTHQIGKKIVTMPRFVECFPFERLCVTMEPCRSGKEEQGVWTLPSWKTGCRKLYPWRQRPLRLTAKRDANCRFGDSLPGASFNRAQVRCRRCPDAGVELAQ
jgi:hypothetical protein